jgi:hypothetical protein
MKKVLIIESNEAVIDRNYRNTSIVHVRNSVIIADYLNADLISCETEIEGVMNKDYFAIICMYASGYMMYNKYLKILVKNKNAKVFWMTNEYSVPDNILLRKWVVECGIGYEMICNLKRESYKQSHLNLTIRDRKLNDWIREWYCVNLNCLIFDNSFVRTAKVDLFRSHKEDCVYYSTFRPDRVKDMLDYNGADYGISTSQKNVIEFKKAGIVARFGDKLSWTKGEETLYNYKYSLYFEDTHTHTNYNHLANRFYECLMLDVLLIYDYRCLSTIQQSGYLISEFMIVKNAKDLTELIAKLDNDQMLYEQMLNIQRSNIPLVIEEKQKVLEEISSIVFSEREPFAPELIETENISKRKKSVSEQINLFE